MPKLVTQDIKGQVVDATKKSSEQYLTFELAGESYGVEILKVQEIRGWEPIRKIPKTPSYIKGALNLRGTIVPIIDLCERFGMDKIEYSPFTVVIIVTISSPGDARANVMGVVADAVSDVLDVKVSDIKRAPDLGANIDTRYMRGMYVGKQGMVMLLDVEKLLNPDEFESFNGEL
ncbi:MAG: chemotaxis protein CheW [Gammaproteobacteria bacterium]